MNYRLSWFRKPERGAGRPALVGTEEVPSLAEMFTRVETLTATRYVVRVEAIQSPEAA